MLKWPLFCKGNQVFLKKNREFFQPPSEARWFSFSSTVRRGAEEVPRIGNVAPQKLSYFLEFWNENRRKWSLGIDAGTEYVFIMYLTTRGPSYLARKVKNGRFERF